MPYAEKTTVSTAKSQEEIDRVLRRFNASAIGWLRDDAIAQVMLAFKRGQKSYRFSFSLPPIKNFESYRRKGGYSTYTRTPVAAKAAHDQEVRRLFRSLALYVKGTLDAIDSGIVSADEALLPFMVLPGGQTMAQHLAPQVQIMLESGQVPGLHLALAASIKE